MKKSYNPFKMWGFWIGIILAVINYILMFTPIIGYNGTLDSGWYYTMFKCPSNFPFFNICAKGVFGLTAIIWLPIIGWGIHSLFRRLRK